MRFICLSLILALPAAATSRPTRSITARTSSPVLQERCYACHGALAQKSKLRVDSGANLLKAGVIVPGKPGESELIARVSSEDDETRMPPEGHALKPEQIAKLKAWIEQGAKVPADDAPEPDPRDHWSFRTPVRPPDSKYRITNHGTRSTRFIAAKWAEKGLDAGQARRQARAAAPRVPRPHRPAADRGADRRIPEGRRRPTPTRRWSISCSRRRSTASAGAGTSSTSGATPTGGASARNSATASGTSGTGATGSSESFNADLGYDEMIRQMLAADELYPTDPQKLRATGYLARPYFLFNRTTWLDEVVEHTGKGFLGLTFNCAKCHDHKYDPIKQTDYYRFRAIFEPYQVRTDLVPGEADVDEGRHPAGVRLQPRREDAVPHSRRRAQPGQGPRGEAGPAAVPRAGRLEDQRR